MSFCRLANRTRQCRVLAGLTLTLVLAGCGGGGSAVSAPAVNPAPPPITQTQVAYFFDGPVANLHYSALPSGLSGNTDLSGLFSFNAGDTVTFSFGGITLGSTKPANSLNGAVIVTAMSLTGETDPTNSPKAGALTVLLNALDAVDTWLLGQAPQVPVGTLVLPLATASGYSTLVTDLGSLGNPQGISSAQLQAMLTALYLTDSNGAPNVPVVSDLNAQTLVTVAAASAPLAGTVWKGSLINAANVSVPWYVYLSPDGNAYSFSAAGQIDSGSWSDTNGTIDLSFTSPPPSGNPWAGARFSSGATSFTGGGIDLTAGTPTLTVTASEAIASSAQPTSYTGAWHAVLTPSTTGPAATTALILVDATGQLHGVSSDHQLLSGTVDLTSGLASATSSATGVTLSLNFATLTGTESSNSAVQDNIALTRGAAF